LKRGATGGAPRPHQTRIPAHSILDEGPPGRGKKDGGGRGVGYSPTNRTSESRGTIVPDLKRGTGDQSQKRRRKWG